MIKELDNFLGRRSVVKIGVGDGVIVSVDGSGEAFRHHIKTDKELIKVLRRKETLERKTGFALSALKSLLTNLATHGVESVDTEAYNVELLTEVDEKNPFVVDGDVKETFKKSINFLLQGKGQDFDWIADQLLISSRIRNAEFPGAIEAPKANLVGLIRSIKSSK